MSTLYPSSKQNFTNSAGTSFLSSPDHGTTHAAVQDTIGAIEDTIGTTAGTNVLKNFAAGDLPTRHNTSGTFTEVLGGGTLTNTVINNGTLGTPIITGFAQNAVPGSALTTMALGYAQTTAPQGTITGSVALTGLTTTVTVPSGNRGVKITGWLSQVYSTTDTDRANLQILEGGTARSTAYGRASVSSNGWGGATVMWFGTPTVGAHTYNLSVNLTGVGSATVYAGPEAPGFILAELI